MQENHNLDIDREAEEHGYETAQPFDLVTTKEAIIPTVENQIQTLIKGVDDGLINPLDVFATFRKLEAIFNDAKKKVDALAFEEAEKYDKTFTFSGVEFTRKEGSERVNYTEDEVYNELTEKLKARQSLLKIVAKSGEQVFDSEGLEVPKVSVKYDKSSLVVKFKK
jgi:hypothetical protein